MSVEEPTVPSPARPSGPPAQALSWAMVAGLLALCMLFLFSDVRALWETAAAIDPMWLAVPFLATIVSYATMARSYEQIARAAGVRVGFAEMLRITLVANTVNYIVTSGGLSGLAVRVYFFVRMKVHPGRALIISLTQTFLTNVVLLFCTVVGFVHLLRTTDLGGFAFGSMALLLGMSLLVALLATLLLVHRQLRRRTLFLLAEATNWFLRRFFPGRKPARVRLWRFQRNLNQGIEFLLARKREMVAPTLWIVADWTATLAILYVAFIAVGHPVPVPVVMAGFSIGVTVSLVSLVPGGLGIMEGSMAAVFAALAVPLEKSLVAVLIFRVAYYVFPTVVAVFFFRRMMVAGAPDVSALLGERQA